MECSTDLTPPGWLSGDSLNNISMPAIGYETFLLAESMAHLLLFTGLIQEIFSPGAHNCDMGKDKKSH
jgi:hypothetical protein